MTLNIDELNDDFFSDTKLIGIISSLKHYRLCWELNSRFGYNFRLNPEIEIDLLKKQRHYYFHIYQHHDPANFVDHYLYHNHYDGEYLLNEFKHMDYLWLIKGDGCMDTDCNETIRRIKGIDGIQMANELDVDKIRNKGNMVF
jgi:hypothetical protein